MKEQILNSDTPIELKAMDVVARMGIIAARAELYRLNEKADVKRAANVDEKGGGFAGLTTDYMGDKEKSRYKLLKLGLMLSEPCSLVEAKMKIRHR